MCKKSRLRACVRLAGIQRAPTFFTRPKVKNCLRAAAPPILIGRSRRRGEKRGERIDGIEPLCGPPRRSRSTSKCSRSIESPHERFVAIESRRGESSSALPSPTVVARSRRGGKSTHRAQPNGSSRRSPLNAQLSATGVCHDVPDLRRRSTRQQRLHHVDSRLGFPAGEPPGRQVPSMRFSPASAVEGGASNDVEDPRTDPPRIPFSTSQPNKSRKRCSDDTDEAAMSAANSKRQQSSPLGSVTNLLVHGTEQ